MLLFIWRKGEYYSYEDDLINFEEILLMSSMSFESGITNDGKLFIFYWENLAIIDILLSFSSLMLLASFINSEFWLSKLFNKNNITG